jgi:predicted PurR-regulated permease PerM
LSILVLAVIFLMEQAMGLLEVRAMGQGLGLSPLLVFFSLIFWAWLWGIPGMILAVPILAVIKIVCTNIPALKSLAMMMSS